MQAEQSPQQPINSPTMEKAPSLSAQSSGFDRKDFLEQLIKVGENLKGKYAATVAVYSKYLIPLESNLQKNALRAQSNYNERDKIELLNKVEKLTVQRNTLEIAMKQVSSRYQQQMLDNSRLIDENSTLQHSEQELEANMRELLANLDDKMKTIATIQEDKAKLVEQLEQKSNEYNRLLQSYMRDNNQLAQKLNEINVMEQTLQEKNKKLEEDRFYLENMKKQFEDKKQQTYVKMSDSPVKSKQPKLEKLPQHEQKDEKQEYAKNPYKKVIKHHSSEIYCMTSTYNGNILATCGGDKIIKLYDPLNLKTLNTINTNSAESIFISLHLNYVGDKLVTGSTDKSVSIYSTATGKQLSCFVGHGEKVNAVAFSNSKEKCASGSDDRQLKFWDLQKGSNTLSVNCGKSVKVITPNLAEPIVYSGHSDGSIRVYSINQGNGPLSQIKGLIDYPISSITLSSNRNQILVGSTEGTALHILDLRLNKALKKFEDKDFYNTGQHFRADYSPTERYVLAGNFEGAIFYWDVDSNKRVGKLTGHEGTVTSVLYHPFTNILASSDSKGNLILWN